MSTSAVAALDFREHTVDIRGGKVVPGGRTNHFELLPYPNAWLMAARQVESLADPLGDGHAAGARHPLNFAIFGIF